MNCKKCGMVSNEAVKFCGQCGAMLEVNEAKPMEVQEDLMQDPEQVEEQSVEQTPEEATEQNSEAPPEQIPEKASEQASEVPSEQVPEIPSEQAPEVPSEQAPETPSEQALESASEEEKPKKKPLGLIVGIAVALVAVIVGVILFSGPNVADEMRSQLEELNSNSYSEIKEWLEVDFEEYFEEYFDLRIRATDTEDWFLEDGFLDDEDRFIRWRFTIDEEREELFIELIYRVMPLSEKLENQLEELDPNSLSDIIEWLERTEAEHGDDIYTLVVWQENPGGTPISPDFVDMEYEDLFEGWTFDIQDGFRLSVRINMVFHDVKSFELGETFESNGLEITFGENLRWSILDNEAHFRFGTEYIQVPVTLANISDDIIDIFFPTVHSPDGTWNLTSVGTGTRGNLTSFDGISPGETQEIYLFIAFEGDGEYWMEFYNHPVRIEVTISIDSSDFQEEREALLAAIEPDEEDSTPEEYLIRRWVDGLLVGAPLPVVGEAETIEFREDGTVLITENGVERTATWEMGESDLFGFDAIIIEGVEFYLIVDHFLLMLLDEHGSVLGWIRER